MKINTPLDKIQVWHCVYFCRRESMLSIDSFLLMKKFLRQVFKVLHSLIQTDVSSFYSHSNPKTPYELSRPDYLPFLDQASVFLPPCLLVLLFFSSPEFHLFPLHLSISKTCFSLEPQLKCNFFLKAFACI